MVLEMFLLQIIKYFFCFNYSNKDVSAKDIVSGIISAANRKMLRAATGSHQGKSSSTSGSASTNKKDSVDKSSSETSKSTQKLDTIDSSNKHHSRRNSESVIDFFFRYVFYYLE